MIFAALTVLAALSTQPVAAPEVGNVRFPSPRLLMVKAKSGSTVYVRGPIRVDMSFKKPRVRKPLLKVACLCDIDGDVVCYSGMWERLGTNDKLERSEIMRLFREANEEPPLNERMFAYNNPKLISEKLGDALKDRYQGASYGDSAANRGLFRISKCNGAPKLLLYRFEVWQNGVLVGNYESSHTGLGKYEIPQDWYEWNKYPKKFKYADTY